MGRELGVRPVISGIGSRSRGFFIHSTGINADLLAHQQEPMDWFFGSGKQVGNVEDFIQLGKAAGAAILIELTTLNPVDGQPAAWHIRRGLEMGMDVITANKGPVAYARIELEAIARRHDVQFRFESAVMDGLPLLNLAEFTLPAVGMYAFRGLLNSTTSLVLSMIEQGASEEEAIGRAQELGIAEAEPAYDLDGWDALMKTTIVANVLLNGRITPGAIERVGIRELEAAEIRAAARAGTPIRLVSEAQRSHGLVTASVRPRRLSADDPLRQGKGMSGVISLQTEAMGTITLIEHDAGILQTAYGVLSDLITIARYHRNQ